MKYTYVLCILFVIVGSILITYNMLETKKHDVEHFQLSNNTLWNMNKKTSRNCLELAQDLGVNLDQLSGDEKYNLSLLFNNTYLNANTSVDNRMYGTNECIIPHTDPVVTKYMPNCDMQNGIVLEKDNPTDLSDAIAWKVEKGCIINENAVRNNIVPIAKQYNELRNKQFSDSATATSRAIDVNNQETNRHNRNIAMNEKRIEENINAEDLARRNAADYLNQKQQQKDAEVANIAQTSKYTADSREIDEFMQFVRDKIVGIRYAVFEGYFFDNQNFVNSMFNGTRLPVDAGVIDRIDMFNGMNPNFWRYDKSDFTCMYEFMFRPDVTTNNNDPNSAWSFEIESDDAAFMWFNTDSVNMNDALIKNGGEHGMVKVSAKVKNIVGTDMDKNTNGYKIRIIYGQHGGFAGIVFRAKRPDGSYFTPVNGEYNSSGAYPIANWLNRYMFFNPMKAGLACKIYKGYFNDNFEFFKTTKPLSAVSVTEIYNMSSILPDFGLTKVKYLKDNPQMKYTSDTNINNPRTELSHPNGTYYYSNKNDKELRSVHYYGYFYPPTDGNYTFYLASDDAAYLWVGSDAEGEMVASKAMLNIAGIHGTIAWRAEFTLTGAGYPLPIRIVQGDWGWQTTLMFGYSLPGNPEAIHDLSQHFRH